MQAPLQARNESDTTHGAKTIAEKQVFANNRPDAAAQRKLAEMVSDNPRALQQRALSDVIHDDPRIVAQRHAMNALNGGQFTSQGGGTVRAEASPAPVEEKTNRTGLPDRLKSGIESLSGMSMDHVTVRYNSDRPAQFQASAYAQGSEIHLGAGQERHLPHEAWHVVQQAQGRVRPTLQMKAGMINDDPSLEREADVMGEKASQIQAVHVARGRAGWSDRRPAAQLQRSMQALADERVAQRKILVASEWKTHYDDKFVTDQLPETQRYLDQWPGLSEALGGGNAAAIRSKKDAYFKDELENDVRSMLRKYNEKKSFADVEELRRQLSQDVKLKLLGLENVVGTDQRDGQFSKKDDNAAVGRTGKTQTLRIYRTMSAANWQAYQGSADLNDILWGHGGSLGQALHYFAKSKTAGLDDVLVEFAFSGTAGRLMDYTRVQSGGEGKEPHGGKLTGKSELNDILAIDADIFSVHLRKSKELIKSLNPKVTLIDRALKG